MNILISFIISVMAGIVCHYICKWLGSDEEDNQPKEKPRVATSGFFTLSDWTLISFCLGILYAYAKFQCNIRFFILISAFILR